VRYVIKTRVTFDDALVVLDNLQYPDMGKVLPGESTGLAAMIDSASRYGVRAHPVADEEDDIPRFVRVPTVRERLLQFFAGGAAPVATICVEKGKN
jgi:hypothetical protein